MYENTNYLTTVITRKVTLNYPRLIKPRANDKFGETEPKYGATIIIPKEDNATLKKIDEAVKTAIEIGRFIDSQNVKTPLRDGDEVYPGEKLYENSMFLYASSSFQPNLVDNKLQKIQYRSVEFQCGTYAKVSLQFTPYNFNGKTGVRTELINVQILNGNKLLESRSNPEDDFEVEED